MTSTDRGELSRPLSNAEIETFIVFIEAERSRYIACAIQSAVTALGRRCMLALRRASGRSRSHTGLSGTGLVPPLTNVEESAVT